MRQFLEITIPTTINTREYVAMPPKAQGTTAIHISGKWGSAEDLKVQHASDPRVDQDVWTDVSGNVTGNGTTWVKGTKDVPSEAMYVAVYAVTAITVGSPPPRAWLIYDEQAPG